MGEYLNPDNDGFQEALQSEIYVDKSGLIAYTNRCIGTKQKFICVSRPRRFGKSMAAKMLAAYYCRTCQSRELFQELKISQEPSFEKHLNQHNVIFFNMQQMLSSTDPDKTVIEYLQKEVLMELQEVYSDMFPPEETKLAVALSKIYAKTKQGFIFIIDEWDCIFREKQQDGTLQLAYLDFLRNLLKDRTYVKLAYMTGILPIKKYGTHSALNMFDEYSMMDAGELEEFVGFTASEVDALCQIYDVEVQEMYRWYDGYHLNEQVHIFNPKSVVDALRRKRFGSYWTSTETYEALKIYIDMNYDGLKEAIVQMLGGARCQFNTRTFTNDMTTFTSKDDVLTLLVHLGYLAFDFDTQEVYIPNEEIRSEFLNAMVDKKWSEVIHAVELSRQLLEATLQGVKIETINQ